jgi:hypothetical protein
VPDIVALRLMALIEPTSTPAQRYDAMCLIAGFMADLHYIRTAFIELK